MRIERNGDYITIDIDLAVRNCRCVNATQHQRSLHIPVVPAPAGANPTTFPDNAETGRVETMGEYELERLIAAFQEVCAYAKQGKELIVVATARDGKLSFNVVADETVDNYLVQAGVWQAYALWWPSRRLHHAVTRDAIISEYNTLANWVRDEILQRYALRFEIIRACSKNPSLCVSENYEA